MTIMINDVSPRVHYLATDGETTFVIPFEWLLDSHLRVYVNDVLCTYDAPPLDHMHYSTVGQDIEGGGTLTFGAPGRTAGDRVVIYRDLPIDSPVDFPTAGIFPVTALNDAFDEMTAAIQQTEVNVLHRSLRQYVNDFLHPLNPIPYSHVRAGKLLGFDAVGQPTTVGKDEIGGGLSGIWTGDEPPPLPWADGDLWWESDTGRLFVWYVDIDSGQWVEIGGGSGGTGSIALTPKDFGAVGDGVANDLGALQAMLDAAQATGRPALITGGIYAVTGGSPSVPSGIVLQGDPTGIIWQKDTSTAGSTDPGNGERSALHIPKESLNILIDGVHLRGPYWPVGNVRRVIIGIPGTGYANSFAVTSVTGMTGTATASGGAVQSVTITGQGTPQIGNKVEINLSAGGGSGARAYAIFQDFTYRSIGIAVSGRYDEYFYENPSHPTSPAANTLSDPSRAISIRNCDLEGFGQSGMLIDNVLDLEIANCRIRRSGRDAIRLYGVVRFRVANNSIDQCAPGSSSEGVYPYNNVYGIEATRIYNSTLSNGDTTDYPCSQFGIVSGNIIRCCWGWKSMGSHGGQHIGFYGNHCYDSHIGIGWDKGGYNAVDGYAPPTDLCEDNNSFIITSSYPMLPRSGIFLTANDDTAENVGRRNKIGSSYIYGYGNDNTEGAIYIGNQGTCSVGKPTIINSLGVGIRLATYNSDVTIGGAVISGVRASGATCYGILIAATTEAALIGSCTFKQSAGDPTMTGISVPAPIVGTAGVVVSETQLAVGNVSLLPNALNLRGGSKDKTLHAWGNISNSAGTVSIAASMGITAASFVSLGVVQLTLREAVTSTSTVVAVASPRSGTDWRFTCSSIDTTHINVSCRDAAGTLINGGFNIMIAAY